MQRPAEQKELFNSPDLTCKELSTLDETSQDSFLTPKRRKKVVFTIEDDSDQEEEDDSDYSGMIKNEDSNSSRSSSSESDSASDAESTYYDTHSSDNEVSSDEPESEWVCICYIY